ncbi:hypothetical protein [Bremerella alba]|uniref:Uncharacterized protein n=1 Tax=Bremerella alba TaxID=980252 RepID=A0A7V8V7S3_9BACT|nr:hypothetical protein [Bremerella alba]MBA2116523.1 hypothetical protein [Bremerella alba]
MTSIGSIDFSLNGRFKGGAAFRLIRPSKESIDFSYSDHRILLAPSTPFAVIQSPGLLSNADSIHYIRTHLEEAFDMLCILGKGSFGTMGTDEEYFAWGYPDNPLEVEYNDSLVFPMRGRAHGDLVPNSQCREIEIPEKPLPKYHVGFRYFRQSQISDDLFDAYRNMFLALESLLSTKSPKCSGESEASWLRRALENESTILNLVNLTPRNCADPVGEIIEIIYKKTRCSLFHAKNGQPTYLPLNRPEDRISTADALRVLSALVVQMSRSWHAISRPSSSFNLELGKEICEKVFKSTTVAVSDNMTTGCNDALDSLKRSSNIISSLKSTEISGTNTKPILMGLICAKQLGYLKEICSMYFVRHEQLLFNRDFETPLRLSDANGLRVKLRIEFENADQPKNRFLR